MLKRVLNQCIDLFYLFGIGKTAVKSADQEIITFIGCVAFSKRVGDGGKLGYPLD